MAQRKFQDLNLADAFLFAVAMRNPEVCRLVLQILLERRIGSVTVNAEQSMLFSSECRSIRLDVYADDEDGNHYNVEMQGENEGNLPRRSRFHQAEMDVLELKPGEGFNSLEPNYVIFICCFDPFGKGLFRYTFTNRCTETELGLADGTVKLFFNTKGTDPAGVSRELLGFLRYVEDSTEECVRELTESAKRRKEDTEPGSAGKSLQPTEQTDAEQAEKGSEADAGTTGRLSESSRQSDGERIRQIHECVKEIKKSREWRRKYMRFEELLQKERREGCAEGREEGWKEGRVEGREEGWKEGRKEGSEQAEARLTALIAKMTEGGEADKLSRLADKAFLEEMYCKYGL